MKSTTGYLFACLLIISCFVIQLTHAGIVETQFKSAETAQIKSCSKGFDLISGNIQYQQQDIVGGLPYIRKYSGTVRPHRTRENDFFDQYITTGGWTDNYHSYLRAIETVNKQSVFYIVKLLGHSGHVYFLYNKRNKKVSRIFTNDPFGDDLGVPLTANTLKEYEFIVGDTGLGNIIIKYRGVAFTFAANTQLKNPNNSSYYNKVNKVDYPTGKSLFLQYDHDLNLKNVRDNRNNKLRFDRYFNDAAGTYRSNARAVTRVLQEFNGVKTQQVTYTYKASSNIDLNGKRFYYPLLQTSRSTLGGEKYYNYQYNTKLMASSKHARVNRYFHVLNEVGNVESGRRVATRNWKITQSNDSQIHTYSTVDGQKANEQKAVYAAKQITFKENVDGRYAEAIYNTTVDANDHTMTLRVNRFDQPACLTVAGKPIRSVIFNSWLSRIDQYIDARGYKTELTYDDKNRVKSLTEAVGMSGLERTTTHVYTTLSNGQPNLTATPNTIIKPNLTVINELNWRGQIKKQIKKSSLPESQDQVVTYSYHEDRNRADYGLLYQYDGPRTDIDDRKYYHYDQYGNLKQEHIVVSKPRDNTVTNYYQNYKEYNSAGKPRLVQGFDGVWTEYSYDDAGVRTTKTVVGELRGNNVVGRSSRAEYDSFGRLKRTFDAYGAKTEYDYDSIGRTKKLIKPDGSFDTYHYFPNSTLQVTRAHDSLGRLAREQWQGLDANGRVSWTREGGDASKVWAQYDYDANGNVKEVRQPEGLVERYGYDAHNRKTSLTDGEGHVTRYDYDLSDNLKYQKAANGTGDDTNFTQTMNPRERWNTDAGYKKHFYNNAGQMTARKHAGYRQCNTLNIDSLGRMATHDCFDPSASNYGFEDLKVIYNYNYDGHGLGRLDNVTYNYQAWKGHPQGVDTFYGYNRYGEVTHKRQDIHTAKQVWQGAKTQMAVNYVYNDNGTQTSLTTPKGNRVDYIYDNNRARLVGVNLNGKPLVTNIDIDGAGRLRGWKWANHNAWYYRDINNQNQITQVRNTGLNEHMDWRYQYDMAGRLRQFDGFGTRTYAYDKKSQLKKEDFVGWGADVYHYDNNGNRKRKEVWQPGKYFNIGYGHTHNRLNRINNETIKTHGAGEIIGLQGHMVHAAYDYMGRKRRDYGVSCTSPQQKKYTCAMWYDYTHKNERVFRYGAWLDRQYMYDENSRLIGEYHGYNQDLIAEYVWLGDIPLAAIVKDKKNGQTRVLYIATDRKNVPARIYDSHTKEVMWSWTPTSYGEMQPWVRDNRVEINLRFPGQYYDEHTKLHYNHHRYYAPQLGRYVEPDPIGLAGGMNPYAYAGNDPVNSIDPTGLFELNWNPLQEVDLGNITGDIGLNNPLGMNFLTDWQIQNNMLDGWSSRSLTSGEITMSQGVFGNRIDYDLPKVISVPWTNDNRALAPFGDIIFPQSQYRNDFSSSSVDASLQDTFIHEMTHVMQYQQGIDVFSAGLSLQWDYSVNNVNVYDFKYVPGKPFSAYNIEQQGDFAIGIFRSRLPNIIKNRGAGGSW